MDTIENLQTLTLQDVPYMLRKNWRILAICAAIGGLLGGLKSLGVPVSYRANLLLRIEERDRMTSQAEITRLTEDLRIANPIEGEIEVLKSRSVMYSTVRENGLGLTATPRVSLVSKLLRRPKPSLKTAYFHAPDSFKNLSMELVVTDPRKSYVLKGPSGDTLLSGNFGQSVDSTSNPYGIWMLITRCGSSEAGQTFDLSYNDHAAIEALSNGLSVEQVGKQTGLLSLRLVGLDPEAVASNLNSIADVYIRQSILRRSEEANVRFSHLNNQLPALRDTLALSENRLRQYRLAVGSVNTERESEQVLSQQADLNRQLVALEQRKQEALDKFTADHSSVQMIDQNIRMLRNRLGGISHKIHLMPAQQQEIDRLEREVASRTDQYNTIVREVSQLQIVRDQNVANVKVIDPAIYGEPMAKRGKGVMLMIGVVAGLILGTGIALVRRLMDPGIESAKLIEHLAGCSILCNIPHSQEEHELTNRSTESARRSRFLAAEYPNAMALEALRGLILPVRHMLAQGTGRLVVFAGPAPSCGKSTIAANFAAVLAQSGQRVLLIDADMRRGKFHDLFGLRSSAGLTEILSNQSEWEATLLDTSFPNLTLLPCGTHTNRSTSLLQSSQLEVLLAKLTEHYDIIIADAPPVLALADAQILATRAVTTVLVLKHGMHPQAEISALKRRMEVAESHILGVVLNDIPPSAPIDGIALSRQVYGYTAEPKY